MKTLKTILFLLLAPIFFTGLLILDKFFTSKNDSWYETVWKKGSKLEVAFAILITPLIAIIWAYMYLFNDFWESLVK